MTFTVFHLRGYSLINLLEPAPSSSVDFNVEFAHKFSQMELRSNEKFWNRQGALIFSKICFLW